MTQNAFPAYFRLAGHLLVIFASLGLSSCERREVKPPVAPPSPTATSAAAPRTSAEGTLIVVKRFAVTTSSGVHGFSVGKTVTIVRKAPDGYVVSDGKVEGFAPRDSVTSNLDVADAAKEEVAKSVLAAQATPAPAKVQPSAAPKPDNEAAIKKARQISEMEAASRALSVRILAAQNERGDKGYPRNGGARLPSGNRNVSPLGKDAMNIEKLLADRAEMAVRITAVKNNTPGPNP